MKEHEWVCRSHEEETPHTITLVKLGDEPVPPPCEKCGEPMRKVWTTPTFAYSLDWRARRG